MMIQVPPLVSAKLHYRYSNAVGAAFSAPVLLCHPGTPPFWFCVVCPVWLVFALVVFFRVVLVLMCPPMFVVLSPAFT